MAEVICMSICDNCSHNSVCGKRKSTGGVDRCKTYEKKLNGDLMAVFGQIEKIYEQAKKSSYVRNPMAYAIYKVWKKVDGGKKNG
jgi:hypothetical protein